MNGNLIGVCKYYGQSIVIPADNYKDEEEKCVKATLLCTCDEAVKNKKIQSACNKIDELFGNEKSEIKMFGEEQIGILKQAVSLVANYGALNVCVTFGFGIKGNIKINGKQEIEITRENKENYKEIISK